MTTFTRQQIEALAVGSKIARCFDGRQGSFEPVTSIFAKQDDIAGKLFVCGYARFSDNGQMSFSVKEGEEIGRFCRFEEEAR